MHTSHKKGREKDKYGGGRGREEVNTVSVVVFLSATVLTRGFFRELNDYL